ncbi:MAG: type II toxin-antitoxin system HicB family antitoxin [Opitutaceae bacterium]|jgi:predicted RNase H-like HicB family nuclease|nr:type II toxin-antitoxin system HicB family antitoxin [Opitutaceae bacterium]MBP9914036.1 type II toxin-antitoxin system HicB family antitoxin [Opitutaceae bacterium]
MKYSVTLVESDEGWAVWCDSLSGCCSQGATREEALANIREAISEYLAAKAEELSGDSAVRTVSREEVVV